MNRQAQAESTSSGSSQRDHLITGKFWFPAIFFTSMVGLYIWAHVGEVHVDASRLHIVVELLMMLIIIGGAIYFWVRLLQSRRMENVLVKELEIAQDQVSRWQQEEKNLLHDLKKAVERQFAEWNFNPSEREIAWCLLKGMSMKDIADSRDSTDRSIRQQSYVLYHKAGLAGRAELSAYFLGGMMHLDQD